jgi:hypothetical protein
MKWFCTLLLVCNFTFVSAQNVWEIGLFENQGDLGFHAPLSIGFDFSKDERIKTFGLKNWYDGFCVGFHYRVIERPATMKLEILNNELRIHSYILNDFFSIPFGYQFNYQKKWNKASVFLGAKPTIYGQVYSMSKESFQQMSVGIGFGGECFTGGRMDLNSNISIQTRLGYKYESQRDFGDNTGFFVKLGLITKK